MAGAKPRLSIFVELYAIYAGQRMELKDQRISKITQIVYINVGTFIFIFLYFSLFLKRVRR